MPVSTAGSGGVVRHDLETVYREHAGGLEQFAAMQIAPPIFMPATKGIYQREAVESILGRAGATARRQRGQDPARTDFAYEDRAYNLIEYANSREIDEQDREDFQHVEDLEQNAVRRVAEMNLREYEFDAAAAMFNTTDYAVVAEATFDPATDRGVTVANKWDTSSGTPVDDVELAKLAVRSKIGVEPDAIAMTRAALVALSNNTNVVGRISPTLIPSGQLSVDLIRSIFLVDHVFILDAHYATGKPSTTAPNPAGLAPIWDDTKVSVFKWSDATAIRDDVAAFRTLTLRDALRVREIETKVGVEYIGRERLEFHQLHLDAACVVDDVL